MKKLYAVFFPCVLLSALCFMISHPQDTLNAAWQGFSLWAQVVLPALFPFLVAANLILSSKWLEAIGKCFEPLMVPCFHLPGCAALPLLMGFTSGFPVGAILTRRLYDEKKLTLTEVEHLLAFTNNSSPLFILGSIGAGLFGQPEIGQLLLIVLFGSNLVLGLLLRFTHPRPQSQKYPLTTSCSLSKPQASLGEAIRVALTSSSTVGGCIVLFSVFTQMLSVWGITSWLCCLITPIFRLFHLNPQMAEGFMQGLFEITLGCQTTVHTQGELYGQLIILCLIMSFSGISIWIQIFSLMSPLPIHWGRYLFCRIVQGLLSLLLLFLLFPYLHEIPVFAAPVFPEPFASLLYAFDYWTLSFLLLGGLFLLLLVCIRKQLQNRF